MKANHFTTEEIRNNWQSIKGAYIAQFRAYPGGGAQADSSAVLSAPVIIIPDWVVVTDDPYASRVKKVTPC